MTAMNVSYLYKEARLNIEPAYAGATISIRLPAHSTSTFSSRPQSGRTVITDSYVDRTEDAFARRHLASEASIFFRRIHKSPRSFLWRILDERKVLEVRSIDLSQDKFNKGEANLTMLLSLPQAIRPYGVAFAELEEKDALIAFVLTEANELYTLMLHKDFFVRAAASESPVEEWCKSCKPAALGIRQPYRLVATSAKELLISLHDGSLLRLERKSGDDGTTWRESFFAETGWGTSFKGLIPWKSHNTVRFGNADLEASTAASIQLSPDRAHIFTVCLNHTLRAFNVETGKIGVHTDLLGENVNNDPQKQAQWLMGSSQSTLMQIVSVPGAQDGDQYCVVTYSPKKHQFKFWGIRDADSPVNGIHDIQSDIDFVPPVDELMDTTVWNLEEFFVKATPGWRGSELWIRARSGPYSKIYNLKFDLYDTEEIEYTWKNNWVAVESGSLTVEALKALPENPEDQTLHNFNTYNPSSTEAWLDFLFFPGRFTTSTLETALFVYNGESEQNANRKIGLGKTSLQERICSAVASRVSLQRDPGQDIAYDQYDANIAVQWHVYYGLVKDLHKRRGAAVSFVYDDEEDMPWLLLSDYVSAIRRSAEVELLSSNQRILASPVEQELPDALSRTLQDGDSLNVAKLLNATRLFRKGFPAGFQRSLKTAITNDIFQGSLSSVPVRMEQFDRLCSLCAQVTDDDVTKLMDALDHFEGFQYLNNDLFIAATQRLVEPETGYDIKKDVTRYGMKLLMRVCQESVEIGFNVLLDLLVLVVFMSQDIDPEELSPDFDAAEIYLVLMDLIKQYDLLSWASSRLWPEKQPQSHGASATDLGSSTDLRASQTKLEAPPRSSTVLEAVVGTNAFDMKFPPVPQSVLITYWSRAWVSIPFRSQGYDAIAHDYMGFILQKREFELATEVVPFLPDTPWATYLRARLCLGKNDFVQASTLFRKAAYCLALGHFDIHQFDQNNLISVEQRDYFSDGLPRYYQHVLGLFEKAKAHSFVADFARLGLQSLPVDSELSPIGSTSYSLAEHLASSPTQGAVAVKTELLSRLFSASMQTHRFEEAYSALTRQVNPILRKSCLTTLITSIVTSSPPQTALLKRLPFTTLAADVDAILVSLCQKTLNIATGPPYHTVLASWRVHRGDWRGAAEVLYQRIARLKGTTEGVLETAVEKGSRGLSDSYLEIINLLACLGEDQRWVIAEPQVSSGERLFGVQPLGVSRDKGKGKPGAGKALKRRIITLENIRAEYQAHLDYLEALETGRFAFNAPSGGADADAMDVW